MNKKQLLLVVIFLLAVASTGTGEMIKTDNKMNEELEKIKHDFPNLTFSNIEESPIKGLYEIIAGDNVFYWSKDGYVIFGEMYTKEGVSLAAGKKQKLWNKKIEKVPLEKALKIGSGKNVVVEFTDPDCPYCRKLNDFFSKRSDVTRYVFLFPLEKIHKNSPNKVAYILSAQDRGRAHDEVYAGKFDNPALPKQSDESIQLVNDNINIARAVGVPGTPVLWVNGTFVNGADMQRIAALLSGEEEVKKK